MRRKRRDGNPEKKITDADFQAMLARGHARGLEADEPESSADPGSSDPATTAEAQEIAESAAQRPTPVESAVVAEAQAEEREDERRELGYSCRYLVQATLPHSRPAEGVQEFTRRAGNMTLHILAPSAIGLPYGRYPRQILAWIGGEAVRTRSPRVHIGDTLREFVCRLGRAYSAGKRGTATALKDQLVRLASADIQSTYRDNTKGQWENKRLSPIDESVVWWDPEDHRQIQQWQADLILAPRFFEALLAAPVPIDLPTLSDFRSPMDMDIYCWLTYRMSYLRKPTLVPWELLHDQYGCGYPRTPRGKRDFRRNFLLRLRRVLSAYDLARVEVLPAGTKLYPSPPHVRLLRPGR